MGKAPSPWMFNLKDGVYTVDQLFELSGKTKSSIRIVMKKYAVKIEYVDVGHLRIINYHWSHSHFVNIFYKKSEDENL